MAGIAAARINNGIGIAGMAGGATIMPVDVFPAAERIGTYEDLIRAIVYATDNGARRDQHEPGRDLVQPG